MSKELFGMQLTPEQQLAYVFEQFTEHDDEAPGRIVRMERTLGRIELAMGKRGEVYWKRIWYDVLKQALVVLTSTAVVAVLALIWLGLKIHIGAGL